MLKGSPVGSPWDADRMTSIEDALRAGAKGLYPSEAAVELLIRWGRAPLDSVRWVKRAGDHRAHLAVGQMLEDTGGYSSSERRVVAIVASLYSPEHPVALEDVVSGLDRSNMALVLAALAHANGSHESVDVRVDDGEPVGFDRLPSLYPWP